MFVVVAIILALRAYCQEKKKRQVFLRDLGAQRTRNEKGKGVSMRRELTSDEEEGEEFDEIDIAELKEAEASMWIEPEELDDTCSIHSHSMLLD